MIIDCACCEVRGSACGECVIGVLLDVPSGAPTVQLDAPERRALAVLADQGLVPRLRLVAVQPRRASPDPPVVDTIRHAG